MHQVVHNEAAHHVVLACRVVAASAVLYVTLARAPKVVPGHHLQFGRSIPFSIVYARFGASVRRNTLCDW